MRHFFSKDFYVMSLFDSFNSFLMNEGSSLSGFVLPVRNAPLASNKTLHHSRAFETLNTREGGVRPKSTFSKTIQSVSVSSVLYRCTLCTPVHSYPGHRHQDTEDVTDRDEDTSAN